MSPTPRKNAPEMGSSLDGGPLDKTYNSFAMDHLMGGSDDDSSADSPDSQPTTPSSSGAVSAFQPGDSVNITMNDDNTFHITYSPTSSPDAADGNGPAKPVKPKSFSAASGDDVASVLSQIGIGGGADDDDQDQDQDTAPADDDGSAMADDGGGSDGAPSPV